MDLRPIEAVLGTRLLRSLKVPSGKHCQKVLEHSRSRIQQNMRGGTGGGWTLKEASDFEEQRDYVDEIRLFTKDKPTGDHVRMNS
jgi:hypothetical protein